MKLHKIFYISSVSLLSVFSSCSEESSIMRDKTPFEIYASIEGSEESINTRVETASETTDDGWSFTRFSHRVFDARPLSQVNDEWEWEEALGFFSKSGNNAVGENSFVNEKMIYARTLEDNTYATFISGDMDVELNGLKSGSAAYFPFVEDIETTGLELRWVKNDDPKKLERCIDGLFMRRLQTEGSTVSGMNFHFYHAFSAMIITRGEGFSNPPAGKDGITVVLEEGYSHARIVDYTGNSNYYKIFEFIYNTGYKKSKEDCKKWETWKSTYSFRQNGVTTIKDVWFVLLPGNIDSNPPKVDHIEIYDDNGIVHDITDFVLYNQSDKSLYGNERYILEIKMEGLKPTVNPVSIIPWGEDVEIAQRQAAGIANKTEYVDFVSAYNTYGTRRNNITSENILMKYGDLTVDEYGNKYWHFYITDDFELETNGDFRITSLHQNDIIDGLNSKVYNVTKPLFSEIAGTLRNINIYININDTKEGSVGGVTGSLKGGTVTSCSVTGSVNCPNANVGILSGDASEGSIVSNCVFSGLLIGKGTSDNKIFASGNSVNIDLSNSSSSGVIFSSSI